MRADLHVHSNASDGTDSPAEVIRRAARAGLDAVALTDHDTVAGHPQARQALTGDLILVPGLELSCQLHGRSVHLLAYLFDPDAGQLAAELTRIRDDRVLRARAMVDRLVELGVDVSWDQVAAIAGPREAFTADWIADGGRAYVTRYALDPVRAIRLVRGAGGAAVLAHPRAGREWELSDEQIAGLAAVGLAGVEVFHPDHTDSERTRLRALVSGLGLLASGGSDDHGALTGHRIGGEVAADGVYEALISMTTGAGSAR